MGKKREPVKSDSNESPKNEPTQDPSIQYDTDLNDPNLNDPNLNDPDLNDPDLNYPNRNAPVQVDVNSCAHVAPGSAMHVDFNHEQIREQFLELSQEDLVEALVDSSCQRDNLHKKLLRSTADFDNLRKRMEKEAILLRARASEGLMLDLLEILDNFDRALAHSLTPKPSTPSPSTPKDSENLREGVGKVHKHMVDTLQRHGLQHMESQGKPFDPSCHEALFTVPIQNGEEDMVTEVVQKGYFLNGTPLRVARVGVSKLVGIEKDESLQNDDLQDDGQQNDDNTENNQG